MLERLDKRMRKQFRAVLELAKEESLMLRMAACVLALRRTGAASEATGTAGLFNDGGK